MKTINEIFEAELVNVENYAKKNLKTMCNLWNEKDSMFKAWKHKEIIDGKEFTVISNSGYHKKHTGTNTELHFIYEFNGYKYQLCYYRKKFTVEYQHCLDESAYTMEISAFKPGQIINETYEIYLENGEKKVKFIEEHSAYSLSEIKKESFYDEENMKYIEREFFYAGCPVQTLYYMSDGTHKFYYMD